jgi:GT2 family glycosyltransferase
MKIHALTLTWNGLYLLNTLKDGLLNSLKDTGLDYTWYLKSNGCTDGTLEECEKWENTKIFKTGHNRDNFSEGVNKLFDFSEAKDDDLILLVNNDLEFKDTKSISNMIKCLTDDVGIVGARLMYRGGEKIQHVGVCFSPHHGNLPWHIKTGQKLSKNDYKNKYYQCVTGALLLCKAKDFVAVGKMDERLVWCFDDVSLCLRMKEYGKKIICCGQTEVEHGESVSLAKNPVNKMFLNHNVSYFKKTWTGKYELDYDKYLKDENYNIV